MQYIAPEVVSIADACLGGLQGRSALLIGPKEQRIPYLQSLQQAGTTYIYQEDTPAFVSSLIPKVQLVISVPDTTGYTIPRITAASIAKGCDRRHTPLLIFDLAPSTSVDELAGLLPTVCLYTPDDMQRILAKDAVNC